MILPGKLPLEFYLCNGTDPDQIYSENRMNYPLLVTYIVSLVINAYVPIKIRHYQVKNKESPNQDSDHSSTNLTDLTTNTILVIFLSCTVASMFAQYRIKPVNLNLYPYHLYTYLVQIIFPKVIALGITLTYYLRHSPLRVTILREISQSMNTIMQCN